MAGKKGTKEYWSMTEGVFNCLIDHKRTVAFKKAIFKTVKSEDVVVDMGTGSGVLAMFAVDAGAKKVYAIEYDDNNIKTLSKNFEINGYKDKIQVIKGDVRKVRIPEKINVIIGEMIATGLIEELQIPAMNNILKYADKKVKVVLKGFENYIDLVFNNEIFYGKSFKLLRYEYPEEENLKSDSFSDKILYAKIDFSKLNKDSLINKKIKIKIRKKGIINGIRISSKSIFFDGSCFDFSFAYSYPIILPINTMQVNKGDKFSINISYKLCEGFKNFKYSIKKQKNVL